VWAAIVALLEHRRAMVAATACVVGGTIWVGAVATERFVSTASAHPLPGAVEQRTLGSLVPSTLRALDRRAETMPGERFVVDWQDPVRLGAAGYGLYNELVRHGYPVKSSIAYEDFVPASEIAGPRDWTTLIHLAIGEEDIARWRAEPTAVAVATADPRTGTQRLLSRRLLDQGVEVLRDAGLDDLIAGYESNAWLAVSDTRLPMEARELARSRVHLGERAVVFVVPRFDE
jgi:hypothetical protein